MLFTSLPSNKCFEGLCNPPGGDWSGLSVIVNQCEYRWVSLPRVSGEINGKRPDHVLQLYPNDNNNSIILSIESKDRSYDLETNVGIQLKQYIKYHLRSFLAVRKVLMATGRFPAEKFLLIQVILFL